MGQDPGVLKKGVRGASKIPGGASGGEQDRIWKGFFWGLRASFNVEDGLIAWGLGAPFVGRLCPRKVVKLGSQEIIQLEGVVGSSQVLAGLCRSGGGTARFNPYRQCDNGRLPEQTGRDQVTCSSIGGRSDIFLGRGQSLVSVGKPFEEIRKSNSGFPQQDRRSGGRVVACTRGVFRNLRSS